MPEITAPAHIRKRNGDVVAFDAEKITVAIQKANLESTDKTFTKRQLDALTKSVVSHISDQDAPGVEYIQDAVERVLIKNNYASTAKAYILYRAAHTRIREAEVDLMDIYDELTYKNAREADLKRENANIDADTAMGTMLKYGSEGSKYFIVHRILPKDIAAAHVNGDIHIHDMDFYMLTETCCQIDLLKLFKDGFSTGHGCLREPNDIRSYAALGCIAIQANQNEMHGGQSIPNFDYSMAPGVVKTFRKQYFIHLGDYFSAALGLNLEDARLLAKAIQKSLPADIRFSTAASYKLRLMEFLPAHQARGGYQPISAEAAGAGAASESAASADPAGPTAPSGPAAPADPTDSATPADSADLVAVVTSLSSARDGALETGDPAALAATTVPGSPAAQADEEMLAALRDSGETVSDLETSVSGVEVVEVPADCAARWPGAVAVRLSRAQQPSTRTAADGTSRTVPAQASHEIILILIPDPWRVAEVLPAE